MVVVTVVQFSSVHRRNTCEKTRLQYGSDLKRIKTQLSLKISENQVNIIGAKSCITLRTKREKDTGEEKKTNSPKTATHRRRKNLIIGRYTIRKLEYRSFRAAERRTGNNGAGRARFSYVYCKGSKE